MKWIVSLLFIAVFVLSACSTPSGVEQGGTTNSSAPSSATVPTTLYHDCIGVPQGIFETGSYENYLEFVTQNDLPDHFIPYEKLSYIAPFDYFHVKADLNAEDWRFYWYTMKANNGVEFGVEFASLLFEDFPLDTTELDVTLEGDLRTLDTTVECLVRLNNAYYLYTDDGKLDLIGIECDRFVVHIVVMGYGKGFEKVNDSHPEIIRNMLHADTAEAAIQAFMDSIGVEAR